MKFNKNKLFLSGAILGLFGAGFVYGSYQISDARAETLTTAGGIYTVYWNPKRQEPPGQPQTQLWSAPS